MLGLDSNWLVELLVQLVPLEQKLVWDLMIIIQTDHLFLVLLEQRLQQVAKVVQVVLQNGRKQISFQNQNLTSRNKRGFILAGAAVAAGARFPLADKVEIFLFPLGGGGKNTSSLSSLSKSMVRLKIQNGNF